MNDVVELIVVVAIFIILIIYIGWAVNDLIKTIMHSSNKKKMFCSLESTLLSYYKSGNTEECFAEIELIFKHIINNDELIKRYYANTSIYYFNNWNSAFDCFWNNDIYTVFYLMSYMPTANIRRLVFLCTK